jgi:type VI secretion system activator RovC-like protein
MKMQLDWGIPNWLDSSSYGDTRRWSEWEWRWEFTRRRDDCRADFLAHKDEVERIPDEVTRWLEGALEGVAKVKRGDRRLRPDEPGFTVSFPDCYNKYGLSRLPNPAIGKQPFYLYFMMFRPYGPAMVVFPEDGVTEVSGETGSVIKFDLTASIDDQLERARQLLERAQKRKLGHLVQPSRKHPAKWLTYLRVLDARESGASLSEMAKVLRWQNPQAAHAVLQQARALQFKWPT